MRTDTAAQLGIQLSTLTQEIDQLGGARPGDAMAAIALLPRLDDLRYNAPDEAAALCRRLVLAAPELAGTESERVSLCAGAMGVLASVKRLQADLRAAGTILRSALKLAGELPVRADLLLRSSAVLTIAGFFADALRITEEAAEIYRSQRDRVGLGKVFVDRAMLLLQLGRNEESLSSSRAALQLVPSDLWRLRSSAQQLVGLVAFNQGNLATACQFQMRALRTLAPEDVFNRAQVRWMLAKMVYRGGNLAKSELLLRQARQALDNPFDRALVTLDLVEILVERQELSEARAYAKEMAALLRPFHRIPRVERAILAFIRAALTDELSASLIDSTRSRVQEGQRGR